MSKVYVDGTDDIVLYRVSSIERATGVSYDLRDQSALLNTQVHEVYSTSPDALFLAFTEWEKKNMINAPNTTFSVEHKVEAAGRSSLTVIEHIMTSTDNSHGEEMRYTVFTMDKLVIPADTFSPISSYISYRSADVPITLTNSCIQTEDGADVGTIRTVQINESNSNRTTTIKYPTIFGEDVRLTNATEAEFRARLNEAAHVYGDSLLHSVVNNFYTLTAEDRKKIHNMLLGEESNEAISVFSANDMSVHQINARGTHALLL